MLMPVPSAPCMTMTLCPLPLQLSTLPTHVNKLTDVGMHASTASCTTFTLSQRGHITGASYSSRRLERTVVHPWPQYERSS